MLTPQRDLVVATHTPSSVVALTRWRKVPRIQLGPYPSKSRRVPPAVVLETHVSVNLDDQQRLGRRVVDQIPGNRPNRDDGIRSGHGWVHCAGMSSAPSSQRAGRVNGPVQHSARATGEALVECGEVTVPVAVDDQLAIQHGARR
jgi:hypothetical protein